MALLSYLFPTSRITMSLVLPFDHMVRNVASLSSTKEIRSKSIPNQTMEQPYIPYFHTKDKETMVINIPEGIMNILSFILPYELKDFIS